MYIVQIYYNLIKIKIKVILAKENVKLRWKLGTTQFLAGTHILQRKMKSCAGNLAQPSF